MTVPVKTPVIEYLEDGATLAFPVPFQFNDPAFLVVRRQVPGQFFADLDPATWSASGAGNPAGGTLSLTASVAGATLKIRRATAIEQPTAYPQFQDFPAASHEGALDRGAMVAQDAAAALSELTVRALLAPEGDVGGTIPARVARLGGKALGFDPLTGAPVAIDQDIAAAAAGLLVLAQKIALATTVVNPIAGQEIGPGAVVQVTNAAGQVESFKSTADFVWEDLALHRFVTPVLAAQFNPQPASGQPPAPTGFTALPFDVFYGPGGRMLTALDDDAAFRARYMPAPAFGGGALNAYFCDTTTGSDANDGKGWATAKATIRGVNGVKAPLIASAAPGVIYVRSHGTCMDRLTGLDHTTAIAAHDVAIIGVDDADGKPTYLGNVFAAADVAFAANGTYAWVQTTATATMTGLSGGGGPGRLHRLDVTDRFVDVLGRMWRLPRELVAQASLDDVAATPDSFWFDAAGGHLHVHLAGGIAPTVNTDLVIGRSNAEIITGVAHRKSYLENLVVLNGLTHGKMYGEAYLLNVAALRGRANDLSFDNQTLVHHKGCITGHATLDNANYHGNGANIASISQSAPPIVGTTAAHGLVTGDQVLVDESVTGAGIGMTPLLGTVQTVTVIDATTFSFDGVDASAYPAYAGSGAAKARNPATRAIEQDFTAYYGGTAEGSNQNSTAHDRVEITSIGGRLEGAWQDCVRDINRAKRWMLRTELAGTRDTAPGATTNHLVMTSNLAEAALDGVRFGGYVDPGSQALSSDLNPIRLLNTDIPSDVAVTAVTAAW